MSSIFVPPSQTRLVTICAHVDHGKTTLADNLIESNGIISERLAGTLRYLDSLEEEQRRGITMRTSAIGLQHVYELPQKKKQGQKQNMILHLLDSPGHTDFSLEVTSSLQCSDGALLVVDSVEGMCARTHQVLREAFTHQLVPILVVNKVDRLCTDLCLTPTEAYLRLRTLLETVNAACAAMLNSKEAISQIDSGENGESSYAEYWDFQPSKGNVIFGSALHGWGFTVPSLTRSLFRSDTISLKPKVLKQYIFGDFTYANNKMLKWKQADDRLPVFAEYALQPLWEMYEGVATAATTAGIGSDLFADGRAGTIAAKSKSNKEAKITSTTPGMERVLQAMTTAGTGTHIPTTTAEIQNILDRQGATTEESVLRSLLRRYRPLSDTTLDAVCDQCPSPEVAASSVRSRALALRTKAGNNGDTETFKEILQAVRSCDADANVTVAHVCKFMATDRSHVRDASLPSDPEDSASEDQASNLIMGLARVLSGKLRTGGEYFMFGPKDTSFTPENPPPKKAIRLYLLMGSSFVNVQEVPAGHICAILNLDELLLKTVTLCNVADGMPLSGFDIGIRPLVKVNVEPVDPSDSEALERGLVKLSLADAAVEVTATSKGERILACLGEIHLEQSILDLEKMYCNKELKLRISDPIVEFGETTDWFPNEITDYESFFDDPSPPLRQATVPPYNEEEGLGFANRGRARTIISGRCAAISLRVIPLPERVHKALEKKAMGEETEGDLLHIGKALGCDEKSGAVSAESVFKLLCDSLISLDANGNAVVVSHGIASGTCIRSVESDNGEIFVPVGSMEKGTEGPVSNGRYSRSAGQLEYEEVRKRIRSGVFSRLSQNSDTDPVDPVGLNMWRQQMSGSVVAGFQLAMRAGPICEEPVRGVMVVLEGVEIAVKKNPLSADIGKEYSCAKPLSGGMVVAALRSGIRCALITRPARLVEQHLRLTLHSSLAGLGPLYSVLSKRRGKVVEDTMVEGTDLLMITATLPHAESFGLAPELFRKSSGEVTAPELIFSHWERFDVDPFWIPTSLEEREDYGEILQNGDSSTGMDNTALSYIRKVRERKGLLVDSSRTVVAAEKQRTLKR